MTRTARQIKLLAAVLDEQGKAESPITVIGTRANLRRDFKPAKRGGGTALRHTRIEAAQARQAWRAAELGLGELT